MHIAMVTDYYFPIVGGITMSIKAQKEGLEQAGHRVTVLCPLHQPSTDPTIIGLPIFKYLRPYNYPIAGPVKKVIAAVKAELQTLGDVDIVHVHSDLAAGIAGLLAAKELGIPSVQTMHARSDVYVQKMLPLPEITSIVPERIHSKYISHRDAAIDLKELNAQTRTARRMWRLMVSQANYADQVIAPSAHFASKLKRHGVHKPITVLSNGIADSVIKELSAIKTRTHKTSEALKLIWCARVSAEKRPIEFLQAVKLSSHLVEVDMYGDGAGFKEVRRFITKHGLSNIVRLHGEVAQAEVLQAMSNHHVFVSTSFNFDTQSIVLLEAIATGLPVIYCDPDMAEVVPAEGALLTKSPQPEDIAAAIRMLQEKPQRISQMSKAMLAHRNRITQSDHLKRLLAIYSETISKAIAS